MATQVQQPHFVFFPYMAQGHMIPIVDLAILLAQRGVKITIVTTPLNAARFKSALARAIESGLPIQVIRLRFPSDEVGLPEGCEHFDLITTGDAAIRFFTAANMLGEPVKNLFQELFPKPSCIVSDICLLYTAHVAATYKIPRITFHGTNCFCVVCMQRLHTNGILETESENFVVPDLPHRVEFTKSQIPFGRNFEGMKWKEIREQIAESDKNSYGVVVNTFEDLEPAYVTEYKKLRGDKVWCIGPVSLCNKEELDKAQRGSKSSIDENLCLNWLDSWEPSSVLYACLGSRCSLPHEQMIELGLGLETSNRPFIWVIKSADKLNKLEQWVSESGFENRTKGRCLLIKGWAPQVLILSHPAIGGFLTHCGWNSTLEGIAAGVPLLTWPLFSDQFLNEKFVVHVLEIGLSMGAKVPIMWAEEENIGVILKKDDIKKVIERFFSEGEKTQWRREKAQELKDLAKKATQEDGSSYNSLKLFIQDVVQAAKEM